MRTSTWIKLIGYILLLGGCSGGDDSPPVAGGGGGGTGSAEFFTNTVAQNTASVNEDQEPSDQLAQLTPSTPDSSEPANL
jgi:hypothetical protein